MIKYKKISFLFFISFILIGQKVNGQNNDKRFSIIQAKNEDSLILILPLKYFKKKFEYKDVFFYLENFELDHPFVDSLRMDSDSGKMVMYLIYKDEISIDSIVIRNKGYLKNGTTIFGVVANQQLLDFVCKYGNIDNCRQINKTGFQIFIKFYSRGRYVYLKSNKFIVD